ncbi:MAG: hypothetical protein ACXVCP_16310 [Bdellovibrio sp.]
MKNLKVMALIIMVFHFKEANAHVDDNSYAIQLKDATFLTDQNINIPSGEKKIIFPDRPGVLQSESEAERYLIDFAKKNNVGAGINACAIEAFLENLGYNSQTPMPKDTFIYANTFVRMETGQDNSLDEDLGKNSSLVYWETKPLANYSSDRNLGVKLRLSCLHFQVMIDYSLDEKENLKKSKVAKISRKPIRFTVGEVRKLFNGVLSFNLSDIPTFEVKQ